MRFNSGFKGLNTPHVKWQLLHVSAPWCHLQAAEAQQSTVNPTPTSGAGRPHFYHEVQHSCHPAISIQTSQNYNQCPMVCLIKPSIPTYTPRTSARYSGNGQLLITRPWTRTQTLSWNGQLLMTRPRTCSPTLSWNH